MSRRALRVLGATLVVFAAFAWIAIGCGARTGLVPDLESRDSHADSSDRRDVAPETTCIPLDAIATDGGCVNLQCQQVKCETGTTTIRGTIRDPADRNPIFNALVYVPNATPAAITPGHPVCTACQANATGWPIAQGATDEKGNFVIPNAPSGKNIPLVIQLGKFRKQIVVPEILPCTDTTISPQHLPSKSSEGDLPRIALLTGCDEAECFLTNTLGIDGSEIGGPSEANKHVHAYFANYSVHTFPGSKLGEAYTFVGNLKTMEDYDIIFAACECAPYFRDQKGPGYDNVRAYLKSGGRVFSTHYYYNLWANEKQCTTADNCGGDLETASTAEWTPGKGDLGTSYRIDQTFPRGQAMATWLQGITGGPKGTVALVDTRNDLGKVNKPKGTNWIYQGDLAGTYGSVYMSFNMPVSSPSAQQCGRAVFSDVHLSGTHGIPQDPFPTYCPAAGASDHAANETALAFLFFDLASCVQDDSKPPVQPPGCAP